MTLFEHSANKKIVQKSPLAARMRPRSFDELVGQDHIIGNGRALRKSIDADSLPSIILWGPPGTGKTTLALLVASVTKSHFSPISAVGSGVAELRNIAIDAKERLGMHNKRTIIFIDEIHRFNKSQQEVILPHVETGTLVLIGTTTENPSFEVISPLLSRSHVFTLNPLKNDDIKRIVQMAILDSERGLGSLCPTINEKSMSTLIKLSNGDARTALNAIELATLATEPDRDNKRSITVATIEDAMQRKSLLYDKAGDYHYDTISAFIKSIRGSDPDAAIYWLARMIEAGEDSLFIARRLIILAAEDIGMADPYALSIAVATQHAVHFIGMPEAQIPLAEAAIYLSTAPKSNSAYVAISTARQDAISSRNDPVPLHLRNAVTDLMKKLDYGKEYKYAHDYKGSFTPMENLPKSVSGRRYYKPNDQGYEQEVTKRLHQWWGTKRSGDK